MTKDQLEAAAKFNEIKALCGDVLTDVLIEVSRAMEKHPTWPTDALHAKAVLDEEVGELEQAILQHIYEPEKSSLSNVKEEAIQSAAMTIRFLLSIEEYDFKPCTQHNQKELSS